MSFIVNGINKLLNLSIKASIAYIIIRQISLKFITRKKIFKGDISNYMPNIQKSQEKNPNNFTTLKFTFLNGKLDFNLITKETKFIDFNLVNQFNQLEFKKQKEIEYNSFTFKYLVYHNKQENSIKFLNFEENLSNTNKQLKREYDLIFSDSDIIKITKFLTNINKDFLIYNANTDYFNVNFHIYSKPLLFNENNVTPFFNKYMIAKLSLVSKKWNTHLFLHDEIMYFTNKFVPVKVYYILKDEDKYLMYIDILSESGNNIFQTDIVKILKKNPYLKVFYRKVNSEIIRNWLENDDLVEIFTLDNDNTIHSIYQIEEVNTTKKNSKILLKSTYFKNQLLEILSNIFTEKLIVSDFYVRKHKYT